MISLKAKDVRSENITITNNPIIYFWWFKDSCVKDLLSPLWKEMNHDQISYTEFDDSKYALLYIGKAKKGHDRLIKYHILDSGKFHEKGVNNGRLSSLRQTLCGLLEQPMSEAKQYIDNFMDENCIVQYDECTLDELDLIEKERIQSNYLPLNYQHTKGVLSKEHRKILSSLKKEMRY